MGSNPINVVVTAAEVSFWRRISPRRLSHIRMDNNWPLFQPMKLVSISTNEIHPRIKPLPINRL